MIEEIICRKKDPHGPTWAGVLAFLGMVVGFHMVLTHLPVQLERGPAPETEFPLRLVGSVLLAALGCLLLAPLLGSKRSAYGPVVLRIDTHGITDDRSKPLPRRLSWEEIQSLDTEVKSTNGVVTKAVLYLYVLTSTGRIETVPVRLDGLDRKPDMLARESKRLWMEAKLRRERDVGADRADSADDGDQGSDAIREC